MTESDTFFRKSRRAISTRPTWMRSAWFVITDLLVASRRQTKLAGTCRVSSNVARRGELHICVALALMPLTSLTLAQSIGDLQVSSKPLVLDAMGSFYVGGTTASRSATEIGLYDAGSLEVDQMYVQYMLPHGRHFLPVVFIHGGALSGKSYETTPDGRMGWYEYFARKGFPSYVVDQVGRARSGFDPAPFNRVRAGGAPPASQPAIRRIATERAKVRFRIATEDGQTFLDSQFPSAAGTELGKQTVPDLYEALPAANPNFAALSELSKDLKGAVLMAHSQAGQYPFEAALRGDSDVRAIVTMEPAGCKAAAFSGDEIARLAKVPTLILFGDHIDAPQRFALVQWTDALADCQEYAKRVKAAGGDVTLVHLPDLGIHGNSHMMMQDRNNIQIADLIMKWMGSKASVARPAAAN